jgi:hypothetical protein
MYRSMKMDLPTATDKFTSNVILVQWKKHKW